MFTRQQFMELNFEDKLKVMELKAKFHAKKAKATAAMERIPKNGWNDFHKYHFTRESDVKDEIRPIMLENGLSLSMDLSEFKKGEKFQTKNGWMAETTVEMYFEVVDTETGYFETFTQHGEAMDTGDKGIYKAYSNTIKYALMNYFLIPTGDDVEKDSPEIGQPQDNPNKSQQRQNKPPQQRNGSGNQSQGDGPPRPPQGEKPVYKLIMDAEDQLVQLIGNTKAEIRAELKGKFGQLPMYKQLDEQTGKIVLEQLNKWIENYKHPQG